MCSRTHLREQLRGKSPPLAGPRRREHPVAGPYQLELAKDAWKDGDALVQWAISGIVLPAQPAIAWQPVMTCRRSRTPRKASAGDGLFSVHVNAVCKRNACLRTPFSCDCAFGAQSVVYSLVGSCLQTWRENRPKIGRFSGHSRYYFHFTPPRSLYLLICLQVT